MTFAVRKATYRGRRHARVAADDIRVAAPDQAMLDAMPTVRSRSISRRYRRFFCAWGHRRLARTRADRAGEGPTGTIRRCHPHDPSWQNWPLLEHAVIGNIVPDFPLINKSFTLSIAGDL
jgi:hypothetical protein